MRRVRRLDQLSAVEKKLVRSCRQIILLNDQIRGLTKRYHSARAAGIKGFRYNLRVRIATVEGVRNMYYEYARLRAEEVAELRKELFNENVVIVSGSGRNIIREGRPTSDDDMMDVDVDDDDDDDDDDYDADDDEDDA